ncbi:MAG: hypothetical protein IJF09_05475 [Ruminiclostridium sp.]|nr:hypothetical protein [Ruminiclostridium sp.]
MAIDKEIIKNETNFWGKISSKEYERAKQELSEEDFKKLYRIKNKGTDDEEYQKFNAAEDDEIDRALLINLLIEQKETNKKLNSIKNMLIFFTVLTIISLIVPIILSFSS